MTCYEFSLHINVQHSTPNLNSSQRCIYIAWSPAVVYNSKPKCFICNHCIYTATVLFSLVCSCSQDHIDAVQHNEHLTVDGWSESLFEDCNSGGSQGTTDTSRLVAGAPWFYRLVREFPVLCDVAMSETSRFPRVNLW